MHVWRGTRALNRGYPLVALVEYTGAVEQQPQRAEYYVALALTARKWVILRRLGILCFLRLRSAQMIPFCTPNLLLSMLERLLYRLKTCVGFKGL